MTRAKTILFSLLAALGMTFLVAMPAVVNAQIEINPDLCKGILASDPDNEDCSDLAGSDEDVSNLATTIINIFSLIVGIVSVIVIIVAGLRYIVSGGESANVQGAKNTILYAVVGLVIVIFAQTIVKYVVTKLQE